MQRTALAKLNLSLHITSKQANGYHTLESLIAFADVGDSLTCSEHIPPTPYPLAHEYPDLELTLYVTSAVELDQPFFPSNLIYKAAKALADYGEEMNAGHRRPAHITLEKLIPIGAGLGGGSSDAAAALHLLNEYWQMHLTPNQLAAIVSHIGSDIAACLGGGAQWMSGTGNQLAPANIRAQLWAVIAFPHIHLPASDVYQALQIDERPATSPTEFGAFQTNDTQVLLAYLEQTKNDLTAPAITLAPTVREVLASLEALPNIRLSRMSGSGSACYGLFSSAQHAKDAAQMLSAGHPSLWVRHASLVL